MHELSHAFLRAHEQQAETEEANEQNARTTVLAWGFSRMPSTLGPPKTL